MPSIITISTYVGALATIIVAWVVTLAWLRPVKIIPGIHLVLDGSEPDAIIANVVNKGTKPIYITRCVARGTFPWHHILWRHLRKPLMPFRLYPVARFTAITHDLMSVEPIKLEPQQPVTLRHRLSNHPLAKMHTALFLVEVTLSSGRQIRSATQRAPDRWRLKHAG